MLNCTDSTGESEDTDTMARQELELEAEERYGRRKYRGCRQRQPEEHQSYNDMIPSECCCEPTWRCDVQNRERRSRRRTKSQARCYIPCNDPHESWGHSIEKPSIFNNMNDTLKIHEYYLAKANNRTCKKPQDLYPCDCVIPNVYHPRKKQMGLRRRSCRSEEDPVLSIMRDTINYDVNARACCQYEQCIKNRPNRNVEESDEASDDHLKRNQVTRVSDNLEMNRLILENHMQHKKERTSRLEPCIKYSDRISKLETNEKKQFRLNLTNLENSKETDAKKVEENVENQTRKNSNILPNKPFTTKPCGYQSYMRNKSLEDSTNLTIDRSPDEDGHKEAEDRSMNKSRKPSTIRQSFKFGNEVTSGNRKENREDIPCELMMKNEEDEESSIQKNIYAGGDLELHATKSHILGLIDRAISKEFGNLTDQQQNLDSSRGLAGQDICIQIMRILQSNCCQSLAEDLLNHHDSSVDCIKLLKMLRWDHMTHIQKEFRKLCSLQKFLDTYSPRQSFPAFQSHPVEIEQQRPEERQQQQHEEKQTSGTIP